MTVMFRVLVWVSNRGLDDGVQAPVVQGGHGVGTVRQHSALVDGAFVGDLATVYRRCF
jgi:hypothetical protein